MEVILAPYLCGGFKSIAYACRYKIFKVLYVSCLFAPCAYNSTQFARVDNKEKTNLITNFLNEARLYKVLFYLVWPLDKSIRFALPNESLSSSKLSSRAGTPSMSPSIGCI